MEEPKNVWWNNIEPPEATVAENATHTSGLDADIGTNGNMETHPSVETKVTSDRALKKAQRQAKAQARPKRNRLAIIGSIGLVATMATGLVAANFTKPNPYDSHPSQHASIEYPTTIPGIINECGSIFNFTPNPKHYGQFPEGFFDEQGTGETVKRQTYYQPMSVPAYGYMSNSPLASPPSYISPETTKMPTKEQVLRLMWDGWTIIWYVPPGTEPVSNDEYDIVLTLQTLASIKDYAENNEKTLAMPWMGDKSIPGNRNLAYSSWATTQSCNNWDPAMVNAFKSKALELAQPRPIEPPYAPIAPDGELYPIDVPR